jgi:hypothetical protein
LEKVLISKLDRACSFCDSKAVHRCSDCGTHLKFCSTCCNDIHADVVNHAITTANIDGNCILDSQIPQLLKDHNHECDSKYTKDVMLIDLYTTRKASVELCRCREPSIQMVFYGYWADSPENVGIGD